MPTYLSWRDEFDLYGTLSTATSTQFVMPNLDGLTSTVFNGTGITYTSGVPSGGTLTSIDLVVNSDHTVLQSMTNLTTTVAQVGAFATQATALRALITWIAVVPQQGLTPVTFSTTEIKIADTDGTFTDVLGTGFSQAGETFSGTVTEVKHLAANGTTVLDDITGLNVALATGAAAISSKIGSEQSYLLFGAGNNTLTGFHHAVTNTDFVYTNLDSTPGTDNMVGGPNNDPTNLVRALDYNAAPSAVTVNLNASPVTGGDTDTFSSIVSVIGSSFNDTLTGDGNANTLFGGSGNDTLSGGGGNDFLEGGLGNDTIDGGGGTGDWVQYTLDLTSGVTVSLANTNAQNTGGAGTDTITNVENILGSDFGDTLTGNSGINELDGGLGNDFLTGNGGNDTLNGGAGTDTAGYTFATGAITAILSSTSTVTGDASVGTDTLISIESVRGSQSADTFTATASFSGSSGTFNDFEGLGGDDIVHGNGATRISYTQATNGVTVDLLAGTAHSTLGGDAAGIGNDSFAGVVGSDNLNAVASVRGSGFDDNISAAGARGAFTFYGLGGNDTFTGTTEAINNFDSNLARYDSFTTNAINVSLGATSTVTDLTGSSVGTDTLINVERVRGTSFADTFTANASFLGQYGTQNFFEGMGGNDTITGNGHTVIQYGNALAAVTVDLQAGSAAATAGGDAAGIGNDTILGGVVSIIGSDFNDTLLGSAGAGAESFTGGDGDDTINGRGGLLDRVDYRSDPNGVFVTLAGGYANDGYGHQDTFSNIEGARGSEFDDTLTGDNNDNRLEGQNGNDELNGGGGNDFLVGDDGVDLYAGVFGTNGTPFDSGNDILDGGPGADQMWGGKGNDTYYVDNAGDVVTENANEGTDLVITSISYTLTANVENLTIVSSADGVVATGNTLDNTITGDSYANVLDGSAGADTMIGGTGNDSYFVDNASDAVIENANEGTDTVYASISLTLAANVENLVMQGSADLQGYGNTLTNSIFGNSGNNLIDGGAGADTMTGGAGNDSYVVDNPGDVVTENANEGTDTVLTSINYTLGANVENLVMQGSADLQGYGNGDANAITGNSGNNLIDGGAGADLMSGGAGNDVYFVDNASDAVFENANEGNDSVFATANFTLGANVENLIMQGSSDLQGYGNSDNNVLYGNGGNNLLNGNGGADLMVGGAGNDIYFADDPSDSAFEVANEGNDTVFATCSYGIATNVENLILLGTGDFQAYGSSDNNVIYGNSGNNLINGGAGVDLAVGGAGNDTYFVDDPSDSCFEVAGEGSDAVFASCNYGLAANVETLVMQGSADLQGYGSNDANTLYGNSGNNLLNGAGGADTMIGGAGNDTYFVDNTGDVVFENANEGTDAVFASVNYTLTANVEALVLQGGANLTGTGNALANSLFGNVGDNTLDGAGGADVLQGNAGNDTFVFHAGQGNGDTVVDFAGNGASAGDSLSFVGYGAGATFTNIDATHWQVNYNGGASHDVITFSNGAAIDPSDFAFI